MYLRASAVPGISSVRHRPSPLLCVHRRALSRDRLASIFDSRSSFSLPRCVIPCSPVRKAAGRVVIPISPKQDVWYYPGERRWSLADIVKTLWDSLRPVLACSLPYSHHGDSRCFVSLRLNTFLHARPILSRYHTGLKGESLSNSP